LVFGVTGKRRSIISSVANLTLIMFGPISLRILLVQFATNGNGIVLSVVQKLMANLMGCLSLPNLAIE
jgi:hypothetical protein